MGRAIFAALSGNGLVHQDILQLMSDSRQDIHLSGTPPNLKKGIFKGEDSSMSKTSQRSLPQKQKENMQNMSRTRISPFSWVMIILLLALGAINFADKAVLGLAAVPIIKELHLSPVQYGLVSGSLFWLFSLSSVLVTTWSDRIGTKKVLALLAMTWAIVQFATMFVFSFPALLLTRVVLGAGEGPSYGTSVAAVVGWRSAFALLGGIGLLWVVIWLLVGREYSEKSSLAGDETYVGHPWTRWSQILPIIFSRTVLFSTFAGFSSYWATALYLSWNPVYLVTVRHLKLSDPLYLAGITLPYVVGGIALIAFGALADRVFRRTGSSRRSYVYLVTALLMVSALCLLLAVSVPSTLGAVFFFTLAPIGVVIPMISTIITGVAPEAYRGAVLGTVVAVLTLPGIIAPLVTGLLIQSSGKNVVAGFHNAYLLASLLLLVFGVAFLAFARPDDQQLEEKRSIGVVGLHE
jgi:ACS family hexuronate transporter-like MFS transporter